ncbi:MAG: phosphoribosyltransferase [Thermaceae bacterium]|nr:phosphoribosyltransferase [Thermaceae bacterium]
MKAFQNRQDAGRVLAEALKSYAGQKNLYVLGLPRGGVPVAKEVARALQAPLDVLVVRKLGVPGHLELAMGAIASGGGRVLNQELLRRLRLSPSDIEPVEERECQELSRREQVYRGHRPFPDLKGKTVIVVDDGLATGATMKAALAAVEKGNPARVVVAVPVAPPETLEEIKSLVNQVVCPLVPTDFGAVGEWYQDFPQTSDEEVLAALAQSDHGQQP